MMFEARKSPTRGRLTAALALTPLLLGLALLAGPKPAAAQQWPDVNVYYSPDPSGVDPRSETCPPGCVCGGGGPSTPVTIDFDDDWDPGTPITDQYPEATFTPEGTDLVVHPDAGQYGTSEPNWVVLDDCIDCSRNLNVDFASPVNNLRFRAATPNSSFLEINVYVYQEGVVDPTMVDYSSDYYATDATVDLTDFINVTRIYIENEYGEVAYDDFTFDTGGGEYDCVIDAGTNEEVSVWIDGGSNLGTGDICKMPPDGSTGDHLCGADILIQITQGTGKFTHFRPQIDTLVHHPDCVIPAPDDDEICPLPADTKQIRMNFRRGEAAILGPHRVADLFVDSTGSEVGSPTTVVVSGYEGASANLQRRPFPADGSEVIAEGPVGPEEPCVLQCDFATAGEPGVQDGAVGLPDFNVLVSHYGQTVPACTLGDCDCNGAVGSVDFTQLSIEWGQRCPE